MVQNPEHKPLRAALYARVSTLKGQDVGLQLRDLRDLANHRGWQVTEFVDEGHSGRKASRPGFDRMMEGVRRHRFDVVAVWRLDRLSRGLRHAVNVLGEFRDLKVEFVSVRDGLNFSGPLGMALYALVAALAEAEVEALRERTIAGLRNARAKGKRLGRPPHGEADIAELLKLKKAGLSQAEIARRLGLTTAYVSRKLARYKTSPKALT
jgi:putative DNA-invertase from lambdoid prophage Rac